METYRKIDKDTLEITNTRIHQAKRENLEEEKRMFEDDIRHFKEQIVEIDKQLDELNK